MENVPQMKAESCHSFGKVDQQIGLVHGSSIQACAPVPHKNIPSHAV
jgi:hypothetical protein